MSTTLARLCDVCDDQICTRYSTHPCEVYCTLCTRVYVFAPWSYQEVLGACGLEALYQKYVANCRPQLLLHVSREDWIKIPMMEFLQPSMLVLALQAGVRLSTGAVLEQMQKAAQDEQVRRGLSVGKKLFPGGH